MSLYLSFNPTIHPANHPFIDLSVALSWSSSVALWVQEMPWTCVEVTRIDKLTAACRQHTHHWLTFYTCVEDAIFCKTCDYVERTNERTDGRTIEWTRDKQRQWQWQKFVQPPPNYLPLPTAVECWFFFVYSTCLFRRQLLWKSLTMKFHTVNCWKQTLLLTGSPISSYLIALYQSSRCYRN